jgi:hypothetical protein
LKRGRYNFHKVNNEELGSAGLVVQQGELAKQRQLQDDIAGFKGDSRQGGEAEKAETTHEDPSKFLVTTILQSYAA